MVQSYFPLTSSVCVDLFVMIGASKPIRSVFQRSIQRSYKGEEVLNGWERLTVVDLMRRKVLPWSKVVLKQVVRLWRKTSSGRWWALGGRWSGFGGKSCMRGFFSLQYPGEKLQSNYSH